MRYLLMHQEREVLDMELDEITGGILAIRQAMAPEHIPIGIGFREGLVDRAALNHWWIGRSIPASRSGLRDALEQLGLSTPLCLLTKCFGLSLSDQYWIRPADRELHWKEINFFQNPFFEDVGNVLFGAQAEGSLNLMSPDNTTGGFLKKRWKIIDGERCLMKGGSAPFYQEPLNEVFAGRLMERLGVAHVPYQLIWEKDRPYSVCPDFVTGATELVSAHHISRIAERPEGTTKYQHFLNCCQRLGIPGVQQAMDEMLTVDFLIANGDRHTNNFGALRNADTLEWLGMAPIYDCGTSLWFDRFLRRGGPEPDVFCKPFADRHSEQIKLVGSFDWLDLDRLDGTERDWETILDAAPGYVDETRKQALVKAYQNRVAALAQFVQEKRQAQSTGLSL